MSKKVLVTLAVGQRMKSLFQRYYQPSWELYAKRHGYEMIVFDSVLDKSEAAGSRSIAWQKCLVLDQPETRDRQRVVWLDADILIHPNSPDVGEGIPAEKIGAVDQWSAPNRALSKAIRADYAQVAALKGFHAYENVEAEAYHTNYGLPSGFPSVVQTGVMVLTPALHREAMQAAYAWPGAGPYHYEMPALSHEIQQRGLAHWLDGRFNTLWVEQLHHYYPWINKTQSPLWERILRKSTAGRYHPWLQRELQKAATAVYQRSWFMHFAGSHSDAGWVQIPVA